MFTIEKNAPLPSPRIAAKRYPWREMEVGDSFVVPSTMATSASMAAHHASKRLGTKYTVRKQGDGTHRVFRTA